MKNDCMRLDAGFQANSSTSAGWYWVSLGEKRRLRLYS